MTTTTSTLTISTALAIAEVLRAAQTEGKVYLVRTGEGGPLYGHARSVGDDRGNFLRADRDVREAYLRVTTRGGWDVFVPMAEVIEAAEEGRFGRYDWD